MNLLLSRVAAGALALSYVSAPGSAATTTEPAIVQLPRALVTTARNKPNGTPQGCTPAAGTSFIGALGPTTQSPQTNFVNSYSGILAGADNQICSGPDFDGSGIIAGGSNTISGNESIIGAGAENTISAVQRSLIGAGLFNTVNAQYSSIVGGQYNTIDGQYGGAFGWSFIGGGYQNTIANAATESPLYGMSSFIGGGYNNSVAANYGVLGGGATNSVTGDYGTAAGGYTNSVTGEYGTVAGGFGNTATGVQSFVGGGFQNNASGKNGSIPGGTKNWANGINSFAAGTQAKAVQDGTFVWSDYVNGSNQVVSTGKNQFVARATGGFYLYSSTSLTGVALAPGSGAWSTLSDRNVKTEIASVDNARILAKLAAMPVSEWSYKAQGTGVRHLGPMAQDFRAAFGLGEDDRHISTVDEEGVALAAIKALAARNAALEAKDKSLQAKGAAIEAKFARLEQRLDALETRSRSAAAN